jgi:hypothetical protein
MASKRAFQSLIRWRDMREEYSDYTKVLETKTRIYVLDDRRLARFKDESSTGNIHLLLHELQFLRSCLKQDVCHWIEDELSNSPASIVQGHLRTSPNSVVFASLLPVKTAVGPGFISMIPLYL